MHILFVTPHVPSRIRVRPFNLIKSLSAMHDISLVALLVQQYEQELVKDIEDYCISVDIVPLPKWQAYANCLQALPTRTPLRVAYYRSAAFVQRIEEVIERQKIDLVHGDLVKVVPALRAVLAQRNIPILYDSLDCNSWFLQQKMASARNPLKKAFDYSELQRMRHYERQALVDIDQIIISAERDRDQLVELTGRPQQVEIVRNCVDTDYFTLWTGPRVPNSLVFCAKLDYFPNSQGIIDFCEHSLPLIWKRHPQVHLTIVGNNPPPAIRALGSDERITVTGFVPDTRPYLGSASVALAPLLVAAGTQFKIMEALAMGLPTATTPRCCRALGLQDGVHLLVGEGPQAYADAVMKLLENPQLGQQLGSAGRQFVTQHFSWTSAANQLNKLYHTIASAEKQQDPVLDLAPLS